MWLYVQGGIAKDGGYTLNWLCRSLMTVNVWGGGNVQFVTLSTATSATSIYIVDKHARRQICWKLMQLKCYAYPALVGKELQEKGSANMLHVSAGHSGAGYAERSCKHHMFTRMVCHVS